MLNKKAYKIVRRMIERRDELGIKVFERVATILDCGVEAEGSLEAGKLFSEVCLGGLGSVEIAPQDFGEFSMLSVFVDVKSPAIACLASQKAGWKIKAYGFFAMGSGPARALAKKPRETFEKIGYEEESDVAVIALETSKYPSEEVVKYIADACNVDPHNLYILIAKTSSIVGSVQISARVVETALFKLDLLGYDARKIKHAYGTAPIAPILGDDIKMMGITNDMIIYGSRVYLFGEEEIDISKVPSISSSSYGKSFLEIFKEADYDFYKIDPKIFAPAEVYYNNIKNGKLKKAGNVNKNVLKTVFS